MCLPPVRLFSMNAGKKLRIQVFSLSLFASSSNGDDRVLVDQ